MTEEKSIPQISFSWKARLKSFGYAIDGILHFFRTGHNAQIQLAASFVVLLLSLYFHVSTTEGVLLIICIAMVWIMEMINTALEKTMDFISLQYHPQIKRIKDLAAGAVLIAAVAAFLAGALIFIPKFYKHDKQFSIPLLFPADRSGSGSDAILPFFPGAGFFPRAVHGPFTFSFPGLEPFPGFYSFFPVAKNS